MLADWLLLDLRVPADLDRQRNRSAPETLEYDRGTARRLRTLLGLEKRFAAKYRVRLNTGEFLTLPRALGADAITLNAYAALGVEPDSIATIAERITQNIRSLIHRLRLKMSATQFSRGLLVGRAVDRAGPIGITRPNGDVRR